MVLVKPSFNAPVVRQVQQAPAIVVQVHCFVAMGAVYNKPPVLRKQYSVFRLCMGVIKQREGHAKNGTEPDGAHKILFILYNHTNYRAGRNRYSNAVLYT